MADQHEAGMEKWTLETFRTISLWQRNLTIPYYFVLGIADACCVTPCFENDSDSNCDNNTRREILASRTLVIAETKLVKPEYNLDSCNSTISEVTHEASAPEIAQEAVDTVGPEVGDVSLTPQHSECAEETIKDDMSFGFKKLDCEDDEFDGTKGCDTDGNGVLETKNDEILRQQLDSKDPKDERSQFSDALQVKLDLECSEEADMENCDTDSGSTLSHTVHKHDEGKDNIFASETSDDCLCIALSTKIDDFCLAMLFLSKAYDFIRILYLSISCHIYGFR